MSRVGKKVIAIPPKTEVSMSGYVLTVKGPLGTLTKKMKQDIEITIGASEITLVPKKITLETKALWGTYASHIMNMIKGVSTPFVKKLIVEGIGFKSEVKGKNLVLALGFSHPVNVLIPETLKVTAEKNVIIATGIDKEVVGEFMASVRALKKPEPYKGKGIRYEGEVVKRKQGKKTV
ncbi:MAG: 50S ribosomal protein L6 [Candidatus Zambryskibacteria bacterium RIFCSPLOWO2_02_FULL_39_26]|uniref:50S ribosomal protein L6 n=1 Tax=Candidatus Zambryskibacteria bacterium RIFCSPLOWO2_12_FULL_39_23 TaxID=1802776 RepID=A0A1G2USR0_9BACT|nr:MAG: 50S ribosomal protein L6 [Candidatus Zambryskibacteria bacterium RIFCSPHIGHO2_02_39_10]OHA99609.1 MAG: 50S ribosomal protein L6 [Candidatus Zambryskibacteria bacterium RIFCSPHIGHO2_12_FULL_39_47]OHB10112.1 MAG: 50S ribosomal protein L6 [Candidatus Zambryskibacteria bacterium RIFCSPLOWO2_02_FULL_39_26]OHB12427.1 MAG: 50S ribosomal protein L6 [Candidatus Zambryskibacteria bacterium RIFCSPLOWO2_12_FULL_39_23]